MEIKFRGKSRLTGQWVYGLPKHGSGGGIDYICGWWGEDGGETYHEEEVSEQTIGQYTGLTDKNGEKIYVGDVVKTDYYSGIPGVFNRLTGLIVFHSGKFMVQGIKKYEGIRKELRGFSSIIGNIYENPELLK